MVIPLLLLQESRQPMAAISLPEELITVKPPATTCGLSKLTAKELLPGKRPLADRTLNGHLDGDGDVDGLDLVAMILALWSTPEDPNWNPRTDLVTDLLIDEADLELFLNHFGRDDCPCNE